MAELALQISVGKDKKGQTETAPVFLCHNSRDKDRVKEIADALELEFGTPFFLDAYAIPTGEAFFPFIEEALRTCSGCAIFLGENGWGTTHLWEAEQALLRYRSDPHFKLIPVVLPGMREADFKKLGAGRVFQEINWADFSGKSNEHESLQKLAAALLGENLPQYRGPAQLTPFQMRRDAARWEASRRTEKSILYRGKQLQEAMRMYIENPDFVAALEVQPFLEAAERRERSIWRRMAIAGVTGTITFLILFGATYVAYTVAEQRRLDSMSRQLAMATNEAQSADRALLISARALLLSNTPEAQGNLLRTLVEWRFLDRMLHLDLGIESIAVGVHREIYAGTDSGEIASWKADSATSPQILRSSPKRAAVTVIKIVGGERWIGKENGAVEIETETASGKTFREVVPPNINAGTKDVKILAIEANETGTAENDLVAIGTAAGQLLILNRSTFKTVASFDESDNLRITSLSFDSKSRLLAAGTGTQFILFVDLKKLEIVRYQPGIDGGAIAIAYVNEDSLAVVSAYGALTILKQEDERIIRDRSYALSGLISSAVIDGKRGRLALGDASGLVRLYDLFGNPIVFETLRAHSDQVSALAFGSDDRTLISGSANGTVAVWNLKGDSGVAKALPQFGPEPSLLRLNRRGEILAGATTSGRAGIWRLQKESWLLETDLIEKTFAIAGAESVAPLTSKQSNTGEGFAAIDDLEIPNLAFDENVEHVAWMTNRGMVLLLNRRVDGDVINVIEDAKASGAIELSGDGSVLVYSLHDNQTVAVAKINNEGKIEKRNLDLSNMSEVSSLAVNRDGRYVAVGFNDGKVRIFCAETGKALNEPILVHQDGAVGGVMFTEDSRRLVSFGSGGSGTDRSIAILAFPAMKDIRRLQFQQAEGKVSAISLGTTLGTLAVGDHDGQILLWNLKEAHFITSLKAGTLYVTSILTDDINRRLVSVSSDGTFLSWTLDAKDWIKLACEKANRKFRSAELKELTPNDTEQESCTYKNRF